MTNQNRYHRPQRTRRRYFLHTVATDLRAGLWLFYTPANPRDAATWRKGIADAKRFECALSRIESFLSSRRRGDGQAVHLLQEIRRHWRIVEHGGAEKAILAVEALIARLGEVDNSVHATVFRLPLP